MLTEIEAFLIMVGVVDFIDRPSDFFFDFLFSNFFSLIGCEIKVMSFIRLNDDQNIGILYYNN